MLHYFCDLMCNLRLTSIVCVVRDHDVAPTPELTTDAGRGALARKARRNSQQVAACVGCSGCAG